MHYGFKKSSNKSEPFLFTPKEKDSARGKRIMQIRIVGSGGSIPTPKIGCSCSVCTKAREVGKPYKRNSNSIYLADAKAIFDCPEDISNSVNENGIKEIDALFITHWHPDHCFGLRLLMQYGYDFYSERVNHQLSLFIPENVYKILVKVYPAIKFQLENLGTAKLTLVADREIITINEMTIQPIDFNGKDADTFGFLLSDGSKNVLYSPCDTLGFITYHEFKKLDLWITECGCFSDYKGEISFEKTIQRINEINPAKTIFTHIEEEELNMAGWEYMETLKEKYCDTNFEFAYDTMIIDV